MAATARALAGSDEDLVERVERHVYRGRGPEHFDPGALTREIAAWKRDFPEIQLATFNYREGLWSAWPVPPKGQADGGGASRSQARTRRRTPRPAAARS